MRVPERLVCLTRSRYEARMSQTRSRSAKGASWTVGHRRPGARGAGAEAAATVPPFLSAPTGFYLLYTPVWVGVVAAVLLGRAIAGWGDREYLLFGIAVAAPIWLWPLWPRHRDAEPGAALARRQGAKLALFITVLSFLQNYFGTPFFARCFGLEYRFPARLSLNGYPVFLSLLTVAYFATYFSVMQAGLRLVERVTARWLADWPRLRLLRRFGVSLVLAYAMAFVETLTMATDLLAGYFAYASKERMLFVGSLCYGTLLFCAQLAYLGIDEAGAATRAELVVEAQKAPRSVRQVLWDALAVSMLVLCFYELFAYLLARLA